MSDLDDIASLLGDLNSFGKSSGGAVATAKPTTSNKAPIDLSSLAAEMSSDLANVKGTPDVEVVSSEQVRTLVGLLNSPQKNTVEEAAKAMSNLTLQDQNIPTILNNGAIPPLANHLKNPDANIQLQAAWALSNLMVNEQGRAAALTNGVCPQLVALLVHPLLPLQDRAVVAIANLSLDEAPRAQLAACGAVGPLCNLLNNPDKKVQENTAWAIGNLLANEQVQAAVGANEAACRALISMLSSSVVDIVERSVRAVANIALLEQNSTRLRNLSAIPAVSNLLDSQNNDIKFHACRAINNLAISQDNESAINSCGAVQKLVNLLDNTKNEPLVDQSIQALANLCMGVNVCATVRSCGGVSKITKLLSGNLRAKLHATRCIANLARDTGAADDVRTSGGIQGLVAILSQEDLLKPSALQALANLASSSDSNKQAIAQAGAGTKVAELINSSDFQISSFAATVAAYVTIDSQNSTHEHWRNSGVYKACIKCCQTHGDPNTKVQAVSCLANAAVNDKNMATLGGEGAMAAMIQLLSDSDVSIQKNAAVGLMNYSGGAENQVIMRSHFGPLVVAIQAIYTPETKTQLLKSCINFAQDEECRKALRTAGGIAILVNQLSSSDDDVKEAAALALFNMSFTKENKEEMIKLGAASKAAALSSSSSSATREAGSKLQKLLA